MDRIKGCIFGGAIGDAFGAAYEGKMPPIDVSLNNAWQLTDDTQLTLATGEAIANQGSVDPAALASTFADWFRRRKLSRLGAATTKALSELAQGGHWMLVGKKGEMAAGNGAAMRIAPLGFFLDVRNDTHREVIRDVCRITHHNDEAYAGALAIVAAINAASDGRWNGDGGLLDIVVKVLPNTATRDRLNAMKDLGNDVGILQVAAQYGRSGYVVDSVALALYAAQLIKRIGFERMIIQLICAGGDTDTNASMAGQVAGTLVGFNRLSHHLVDKVPSRHELDVVARSVAAVLSST